MHQKLENWLISVGATFRVQDDFLCLAPQTKSTQKIDVFGSVAISTKHTHRPVKTFWLHCGNGDFFLGLFSGVFYRIRDIDAFCALRPNAENVLQMEDYLERVSFFYATTTPAVFENFRLSSLGDPSQGPSREAMAELFSLPLSGRSFGNYLVLERGLARFEAVVPKTGLDCTLLFLTAECFCLTHDHLALVRDFAASPTWTLFDGDWGNRISPGDPYYQWPTGSAERPETPIDFIND